MEARFHFHISQIKHLSGYEHILASGFEVYYPSTLKSPQNNSILFFKAVPKAGLDDYLNLVNCIIIIPVEDAPVFEALTPANLVLPVKVPRYEFARVLAHAVSRETDTRRYRTLENGAVIGENVILGDGVVIEPQAFIDHGVRIGDHSIIRTGAKIRRFVSIGTDCIVFENAVIGGVGFGLERGPDGIPVRIPHLGGVCIGNRVDVGALATVCSGTIDPTLLEDDVKVDDHVHVAHNVILRRGSMLTACSEISGSCEMGEFSWLGPNSSIMNGAILGAHVTVGMGAVVTKSVNSELTVAGNPAEPTINLKAFKFAKEKLLKAVDEGRI